MALLRSLARQPAFSILAILTLALGIGVNVAIFSALEALVLKPLPFPDADRLVAIYEDSAWLGYPKNTPAPANFLDWRREGKSFESMAATTSCRAVLTGDGVAPEEITCRNVEAVLFPMLGVSPKLGRWFTAAEDHPIPDVVVIAEGLWRRRFGGDPAIVGKSILVSGRSMRIVGVMPASFRFPAAEMEMWVPLGFPPAQWARRGSHFLTTFGKLKAGVSLEQATKELAAIQKRANEKYPNDTNPKMSAFAEPLQEAMLGPMRLALWILMGAAGMVLLIACANVANLLLTRATGRQRELAVRSALGASSASLLRLLFSETLFLTMAGGGLGVMLALAARGVLETLVPEGMKGAVTIGLDWRVLLFAFVVSLAAATLAALTPLLHVLNAPLIDLLRQDSRAGTGRGALRVRNVLVVGELAITVVLLAGAGLMVRSLMEIWKTDLGFQPERLMSMRVGLPPQKYNNEASKLQFYDRSLELIRALPGVAAADFAATPPFTSVGNSMGYRIEGRPPDADDMLVRVGTNDYLKTIGARLLTGRMFTGADRAGADRVVIVNEKFAKTYFPGASAIGKRMSVSGATETVVWRTIVGVVADINERGFDNYTKPVTYIPTSQIDGSSAIFLMVRSSGPDPLALTGAVQKAIQTVDQNQPVTRVRRFEETLKLSQAARRQQMFLLGTFAILSLAMACLGIYAILAYTVELRRQELGVRMALGASQRDVLQLVLGQGLKLSVLGSAIGIGISLVAGRWIESSLYGVKAFDPLTLGGVTILLILVSLAACLAPASRAALTPPAISLRQ